MDRSNIDPEYLRLYREYASALSTYEVAKREWQEFKEREGEMRRGHAGPRTPYGPAPAKAATAPSDIGSEASPDRAPMRVYLGKELGWITLQPSSFAGLDLPNAEETFDWLSHYFRMRRRIFWNTEDHYERCKKAFFEYARSGAPNSAGRRPARDFRGNLDRARQQIREGALLQWHGDDRAAEESLRVARLEIETACYKTWENYRDAPAPKSMEATVGLLVALADAQFVGLDESPIVKVLQGELARLMENPGPAHPRSPE